MSCTCTWLPLFHSFIRKHCALELLSVSQRGCWVAAAAQVWLDVNKAAVLLARDRVFILGVGRALIED